MLARVLVRDDDDQLRDLAAHHPLVELRHDLLDVGAHLVVRRHQHVEPVLLDRSEVLGGVDASLEAVSRQRLCLVSLSRRGAAEGRAGRTGSCGSSIGTVLPRTTMAVVSETRCVSSAMGRATAGNPGTRRLTNSATSFALPLSDSLCTLDLSFSGAEGAIFFFFSLSFVRRHELALAYRDGDLRLLAFGWQFQIQCLLSRVFGAAALKVAGSMVSGAAGRPWRGVRLDWSASD